MIEVVPFNPENLGKIRKVADILTGTSKSLDDVLGEVFGDDVGVTEIDIQLLYELDDQVMECQGCNWWCEIHELDGDQLCDDCRLME